MQIGIEGIDDVLMIMNDKGMQHLQSNNFQIGAQALAAAGPVGGMPPRALIGSSKQRS